MKYKDNDRASHNVIDKRLHPEDIPTLESYYELTENLATVASLSIVARVKKPEISIPKEVNDWGTDCFALLGKPTFDRAPSLSYRQLENLCQRLAHLQDKYPAYFEAIQSIELPAEKKQDVLNPEIYARKLSNFKSQIEDKSIPLDTPAMEGLQCRYNHVPRCSGALFETFRQQALSEPAKPTPAPEMLPVPEFKEYEGKMTVPSPYFKTM